MGRITVTVFVTAALASSAWAQQVGADSQMRSGTERPAGVVTGGSAQTGISLKSDAAQTSPSATAISGGVSVNARDNLRQHERDANVKMVFALETGNYVSDVHVKVVDGRGKVVIDDVSNGPWVLAQLPPGNYTATATYNGKAVSHRFNVGKSGMKTAQFRWPASVEGVGAAETGGGGGQILGTGPQEPR